MHRRKPPWLVSLLLLATLPGCLRNIEAWQPQMDAGTEPVVRGTYTFEITHELAPNAAPVSPDDLDWDDYQPVAESWTYPVHINADAQELAIRDWDGELIYRCDLVNFEGLVWNYRIVEGAFAGGHFIMWPDNLEPRAELTLYGSGVPIAASYRGNILPPSAGPPDAE